MDSHGLLVNESRSSRQVLSASNSECLVDVSLPQELITEILLHLPVKSLLKFKCVSKPWLSLISNPQFIRSHFSKSSSREPDYLNLQLLFATENGMKICSLYSALYEADPFKNVSAIESPAQNNVTVCLNLKKMHPVIGIIHGLVCLNLYGFYLCIWNPALHKVKHLNVYPEASSGLGGVEYFYSFGYEESNDDYKIVCLQTVQGHDAVFYAAVFIYSLKADSWRRIDRLKGFCLEYPGVFAYGKIYWSYDQYASPNWINVSLDMSSEKFVELQLPDHDARDYFLRTGVSGGRPLVLCDYYKGKKADLWVLDKRGAEESWCKLVSIPYNDVNHIWYYGSYLVLWISRKGEIVFHNANGFLVYNWKTKESRNIKLDDHITRKWRVVDYVESLVWPYYP